VSSELSGVSEVRIYPLEYRISNIVEICKDPKGEEARSSQVAEGLNLCKVERILDDIDYEEVRKRKAIYIRLYHEARISQEEGLGISFTDMLTLMAHHKLIVDAEALV
jgi:voltage-dependent calcium channel